MRSTSHARHRPCGRSRDCWSPPHGEVIPSTRIVIWSGNHVVQQVTLILRQLLEDAVDHGHRLSTRDGVLRTEGVVLVAIDPAECGCALYLGRCPMACDVGEVAVAYGLTVTVRSSRPIPRG